MDIPLAWLKARSLFNGNLARSFQDRAFLLLEPRYWAPSSRDQVSSAFRFRVLARSFQERAFLLCGSRFSASSSRDQVPSAFRLKGYAHVYPSNASVTTRILIDLGQWLSLDSGAAYRG